MTETATDNVTDNETAAPELPAEATPEAKAAPAAKKARPVQQVLERLYELHPKMFGARFLPLKLGAFQDILERHPGVFERDDLKAALGFHARSTRYLEAVAAGHKRHDLDANPVEDVAPEHVHHAIMELFRRRQQRGQDAKAWLQQRLVAAIEASGLEREDYEARVHAKDDASLAALDQAFGELREKSARQEALRRAFEASGKSVAEFADMYGMEPAAVQKMLKGPRKPA